MRGFARATLVVLVLLMPLVGIAPSAGAEIKVQGEPPVRPPLPGYPQLSCSIVFESAGKTDCESRTRVGSVNEIHVRATPAIKNVHVFVDNEDTKTQVAAFDCPPKCTVRFPPETGNLRMYIVVEASGAGVASVTLEADAFGLP